MSAPPRLGAVIYDPRVVTIWEIIQAFFEANGCPMDVSLYGNYELMNAALAEGDLDIAWNSPLGWLDAQRRCGGSCRAIAMRDTDRDRVSHLLVRQDSGISSIADLRGKTVATGASDSPQATLIPLGLLARHGLFADRDFVLERHDVLVGKHGDHVGGEQAALKSLIAGQADVAMALDLNWQRWAADGTADPTRITVLATTDAFDHCVFTAREDFPRAVEAQWLDTLFQMSYNNPDHREMMDLEGLKQWLPGRTSGFGPLTEAVRELRYFG